MPNRILYEKICVSDTLALLSGDEERFFYRLLVQCDDFGRCDARASFLRARCFSVMLDSVTDAMVEQWLQRLVDVDLASTYSVEGRPYLVVLTWDSYQQRRAKRSKYPPPDDSASTCLQAPADADIGARIRYPGTRNEERGTYSLSDSTREPQASNGADAPAKAKAARKTAGKSKSTTPPPESMEPNDADYAAGAEVGLTREQVATKTAAMLDHFRGKGELRADWHATLRNWLRNAPKYDQPPGRAQPEPPKPSDSWADFKGRYGGNTVGKGNANGG